MRRRAGVFAVGISSLTICLGILGGTSPAQEPRREGPPEGLCPPGLQRVETHDHSVLCTHGADPADGFAPEPHEAAPPPPAPCIGDGTSGPRIQVLYGYPAGTPNNFQVDYAQILRAVDQVDKWLDDSSPGYDQHYRWLCSSAGRVNVTAVQLPAIGSDGVFTFTDYVNGMKAAGYNSTSRIYHTFVDNIDGAYAFSGQGTLDGDSQAGSANASNTGPAYSMTSGVSLPTFMHEVGHNLGAVNNDAPHSSGAGHCWDDFDRMCYDDGGSYFTGGGLIVVNCDNAIGSSDGDWFADNHYDCGHDDYYSAAPPPAGSYLASHWNVSKNVFLTPAVTEITP